MFETKSKTKSKKMTESDLVQIIDQHLNTSKTYNTKISNERALATKYFNSQPYGNEKKGRSSYVSSEVLETISWALPQILKVFETNDSIVSMDAISPETVKDAELATQYCEYVFRKVNPGFQILYTFIFDALLQKNSVVKVFYDNTKEYTREDYEGLTDQEVVDLLAQPGVQAIERETIDKEVITHHPYPLRGQLEPTTIIESTHNIAIKRIKNGGKGKIKIENIPPEELIVSKLARSLNLDEAPFVAHRVKKTISWLRSQGFDVPDDIADTEVTSTNYSPEALARQALDGTYLSTDDNNSADHSMRLVNVVESYLQVDWDHDGISEWRKVTKVGNKVLDNEECFNQPFVSTSPMPIPHKHYGMSLADLVMDLQYLKSLLMRAMLDSFAFNINPTKAVDMGKLVDPNDLLNTNPGNWIRLRGDAQSSIFSLPSSGVGAEAFQLLGYIDDISESRSGVSKYTQGIDTNAFNKTATGTQAIMNASQEKIALVTRIIAETGLAEIYKKILKVSSTYITEDQLIQSGKYFVTINPKMWMNLETLTVNVGTGEQDKMAEIGQANQIMQMQTQLLQSQKPELMAMVDPTRIYNAGSAILQAMGKKNIIDYFNAPGSAEYQHNLQEAQQHASTPPPTDPLVQAAQIQAQAAIQKAQQDGQIAMQKAQQDAQIKSAEFELQVRDEDRDFELKKLEIQLNYEVEMAKLNQKQNSNELNFVDTKMRANVAVEAYNSDLPNADIKAVHDSGFDNQQLLNDFMVKSLHSLNENQQAIVQHLSTPKQVMHDEQGDVTDMQAVSN